MLLIEGNKFTHTSYYTRYLQWVLLTQKIAESGSKINRSVIINNKWAGVGWHIFFLGLFIGFIWLKIGIHIPIGWHWYWTTRLRGWRHRVTPGAESRNNGQMMSRYGLGRAESEPKARPGLIFFFIASPALAWPVLKIVRPARGSSRAQIWAQILTICTYCVKFLHFFCRV